MSNNRLTVVWTPADLRAAITQLRAQIAAENTDPAPVIDITTRERLA